MSSSEEYKFIPYTQISINQSFKTHQLDTKLKSIVNINAGVDIQFLKSIKSRISSTKQIFCAKKSENSCLKMMPPTIGTRCKYCQKEIRSLQQKFNPNSPPGQKRIQKNQEQRCGLSYQTINKQFVQNTFQTPDLKPNSVYILSIFQSASVILKIVMNFQQSNRRSLPKLVFTHQF